MRRLLLTALAGGVLLGGCAGDDAADTTTASATTAPPAGDAATTTSTEPAPADTTFATDDVDALCADLESLAGIDPDAAPDQTQVDRLLAIAQQAPSGVAEPLRAVATFGQAVVDDRSEQDGAAVREAAVEGATILIAYGNEACGIDVPLFDTIAGV